MRATQAVDERQQARWSHIKAACRLIARTAGVVAGVTGLLWGGIVGLREVGPMVQRGLEIREIQIAGVHRVTKQEVIDRLALKKGMALHQVSLSYLAERLCAIAWIKEATVERWPPHTLRVTVVERKPAAIARVNSEHVLMDEEGTVLARLEGRDEPAFPLLTGIEMKPLLQAEVRLQRTVQASIELARAMAHTVEGRVEIDVSNPSNLVVSAKGMRFQFGGGALVDQWNRFRMVKAVFKPTMLEGKKREGGEVDLRYDNRVIVRERG
jgi:cell division protein FtsQ